jgi:PI-3-kinase-related kinase SMG-1
VLIFLCSADIGRYERESAGNWGSLKAVLTVCVQRRSAHLQMSDICPVLFEKRLSTVPLPGQEGKPFNDIVTIARVSQSVLVLSTKTRPKKIVFIGSDGKQ